MTLAIPEDLHKLMRKHDEVKWSEVARKALWTHAQKLEWMDKALQDSQMTEVDALKIGKSMKRGIARRHGLS